MNPAAAKEHRQPSLNAHHNGKRIPSAEMDLRPGWGAVTV